MQYFAVIATRNSLYTVERESADLLKVRCNWGTFENEGDAYITQAEWDNSHVVVGESARIGPLYVTSRVQRFEEFRPVEVHEERVPSFAEVLRDHIEAQLGMRVILVR